MTKKPWHELLDESLRADKASKEEALYILGVIAVVAIGIIGVIAHYGI